MKHLGDICKINGAEVPAVDCVIGGSPCQDLSIAGKRAGLAGARSGLYMEQIRIIKEMREHDRESGRSGVFVRPRYMVWENVPGAFSSNGGRDFAAVLEEAIRIAEPEIPSIEVPEKGWPTWGGFRDVDGRWSVAWRVLDAQYWGVPQRRRRIALVADFGGASAHEILFVRDSLSGDIESSGTVREGSSGDAESGAYPPIARSITARYGGSPCIDRDPNIVCVGALTPWDGQANRIYGEDGVYPTLPARTKSGMNREAVFCSKPEILDMTHANDVIRECGEVVPTLQSRMGTGGNQVPLTYGIGNGQVNEAANMTAERAQTLNTMHDTQACLTRYGNIRRLTPLECERLQGFPDGWTDIGAWTDENGKTHKESSDSARYKALGNSIALPPWKWVLKRLCAQYERDATMASLFDGIGGFPLIWEQLNGKGRCLWASEIEQFPIAVTKRRFGG